MLNIYVYIHNDFIKNETLRNQTGKQYLNSLIKLIYYREIRDINQVTITDNAAQSNQIDGTEKRANYLSAVTDNLP